ATEATGSLYVADTKNSRIDVFDANGGFRRAIGTPGEGDGQLKEPGGIAVAPDGTIYVADTWNHRVARFSADGQWLGQWKTENPGFFRPPSLLLSKGPLFRADPRHKRDCAF